MSGNFALFVLGLFVLYVSLLKLYLAVKKKEVSLYSKYGVDSEPFQFWALAIGFGFLFFIAFVIIVISY